MDYVKRFFWVIYVVVVISPVYLVSRVVGVVKQAVVEGFRDGVKDFD